MNISPLRLDPDMMVSQVTPMVESVTKRVCHLTGQPTPRVLEALQRTELRFSLMATPTRKIRVLQ